MGAFIIVIVTMLLAVWMAISPYGPDWGQVDNAPSKVAVQAVAANMMEFHEAALRFVTQAANRTPTSTRWEFSYTAQAPVRCPPYSGGAYPANTTTGTCTPPATALVMPSYLSETMPVYDWVVCYQSGTPNVLVTYARTGDEPGGYTAAQIAASLAGFNFPASKSNWYWGVVGAGPSLSLPASLALPGSCTVSLTSGMVAIATAIN